MNQVVCDIVVLDITIARFLARTLPARCSRSSIKPTAFRRARRVAVRANNLKRRNAFRNEPKELQLGGAEERAKCAWSDPAACLVRRERRSLVERSAQRHLTPLERGLLAQHAHDGVHGARA